MLFCVIFIENKGWTMVLFFNKEYRQFESILSDLMAKAKKSNKFLRRIEDFYEVYELDAVHIYFEERLGIIKVKDYAGDEIISLDCHPCKYSELQNAKNERFVIFYTNILKAYHDYCEKLKEKRRVAHKADLIKKIKNNLKKEEAIRQKNLSNALVKLRGL